MGHGCKRLMLCMVVLCLAPGITLSLWAQTNVTRYLRFESNGVVGYGILDDRTIHELDGDFLGVHVKTGRSIALSDVRVLAPVTPSKVIAVGLNYQSHLGSRTPATYPGLFAKFPTCIIGPGEAIVLPRDAEEVHYEGELVVVIGKRTHHVSVEDAPDYIFGVTCGNDVSERNWQRDDLQWFRGKGTDTFGPIGPVVVRGLTYGDLLLEARLNGETGQSQRTSDLLFNVPTIVSYISQYVTLLPGDVIFTGTPGSTKGMRPGDTVEVEIEGVGVLRNPVVRAND